MTEFITGVNQLQVRSGNERKKIKVFFFVLPIVGCLEQEEHRKEMSKDTFQCINNIS